MLWISDLKLFVRLLISLLLMIIFPCHSILFQQFLFSSINLRLQLLSFSFLLFLILRSSTFCVNRWLASLIFMPRIQAAAIIGFCFVQSGFIFTFINSFRLCMIFEFFFLFCILGRGRIPACLFSLFSFETLLWDLAVSKILRRYLAFKHSQWVHQRFKTVRLHFMELHNIRPAQLRESRFRIEKVIIIEGLRARVCPCQGKKSRTNESILGFAWICSSLSFLSWWFLLAQQIRD